MYIASFVIIMNSCCYYTPDSLIQFTLYICVNCLKVLIVYSNLYFPNFQCEYLLYIFVILLWCYLALAKFIGYNIMQ